MEFVHTSVLYQECLDHLNIKPDGIYVDATMGGAGHSKGICQRLTTGRFLGIDRDMDAIENAREKLKEFCSIATFINRNYADIKEILQQEGIPAIDGALLDLGVSSYQLDNPQRGFSYMHDAPLDMRMNRQDALTAYDVVNGYSMEKLSRIIRDYGEEKWAKRIARFIVEQRQKEPIVTTFQLNEVIKKAVPASARRDGPHPSKRTFQAIRIEVNEELEKLSGALQDFFDCLRSGGRLAVITFHSLEDRAAKQLFQSLCEGCQCPKEFPVCVCGKKPRGRLVTRKPILPSEEEIERNPRSRSAKLRVIEKL